MFEAEIFWWNSCFCSMPDVVIRPLFWHPINSLRAGVRNKDHQRMMVDPMFFFIVYHSTLFLTAVNTTAVAQTAVFL